MVKVQAEAENPVQAVICSKEHTVVGHLAQLGCIGQKHVAPKILPHPGNAGRKAYGIIKPVS